MRIVKVFVHLAQGTEGLVFIKLEPYNSLTVLVVDNFKKQKHNVIVHFSWVNLRVIAFKSKR